MHFRKLLHKSDNAPPIASIKENPLVEEKPGKLKKITRKLGRELICTAASVILLGAGTYGGAKIYWRNMEKEASDLPYKKDGLAILISYRTTGLFDKALSPLGKDFIPEYVARTELAFGQKADIVKRGATHQDLIDALEDAKIQNIVLYGHGSWTSWSATDESVRSFELHYDLYRQTDSDDFYWKKYRKSGLFVQHTCGIEKMVDVPAFPIDKVTDGIKFYENRLNLLLGHSLNGYRVSAFFDTGGYSHEGGNSANGYTVEFRVMGESELAFGSIKFYYFKDENTEFFDGMTTSADLEKINFDYYYSLDQHPFHQGFIYSKEQLEEVATFINLVHKTVQENTVTTQIQARSLGYQFFAEDHIIIVEGINYPWQWMFTPFGQERTDLDRYRR